MRWYGYRWGELLTLPIGVFVAMGEQIARMEAGQMRKATLVAHSRDPRDLSERLWYEEFPERRGMQLTDDESAAGWDKLAKILGRRGRR